MLQAPGAGNHPTLDPAFSQASAWKSVLMEKRGDLSWERRVEAALMERKMDEVLPSPSDSSEVPAPGPRSRF